MMCSSEVTCLWWRSVLLLEKKGELEDNYRPVARSCKSNNIRWRPRRAIGIDSHYILIIEFLKLLLSVFMLSFIFVIVCDLCELK
jgi:hypothetical protein